MHHGHNSPKHTVVVSSSKHIGKLNLGSLKASKARPKSSTARRYKDRQGKTRYAGTKDLKLSQMLAAEQVNVNVLNCPLRACNDAVSS